MSGRNVRPRNDAAAWSSDTRKKPFAKRFATERASQTRKPTVAVNGGSATR